ncbi:septal ring lytic transglycosylase RlpA family protein [Legionella londiniensis]|uniref:Endolytic peptidoglycan transglycosylase RlpA n=1 Tax=Legionella londiniensis TaxID=45068 RepID=A0A0W0VNJ5_9GAMM|nr:septal ring lytic transglycosylase RlpA family protein [Legionella londiniensis]KTD21739.1 rare lipoprotein A [Legionella londiniensis]STX93424.1 rare lipoprotein A [Legionella londiniensis]
MRLQFILIVLLLCSCQTKSPLTHHSTVEVKSPQHKKTNTHISPPRKNLGQTEERDGAPKEPVAYTAKQVKPVNEPLSRYGNPAVYKVNGTQYEVKPTSKGYYERGLASWYGTKFHQKRTSSGEDYDLYAMTAAHKTLPLPTYVKVKNLLNNREIIVKVNDRGPFHKDRIIDLSYAAASKLGLLPKGTAPVEIRALTTHDPEKSAQYYLQAGAFSNPDLAQSLYGKLKKLLSAPVHIEKYQTFHVVKLGPFMSREAAERAKVLLAEKGIKNVFSLLQ